MRRLAKYFRPYLLFILLAVVLLFIQANADLALPDYMSRIVNQGIQQGGITHAAPQAIRKQQMDRLLIFVAEADRTRLLEAYSLARVDLPNYTRLIKQYPAIITEEVYVQNTLPASEITWLDGVFTRPWLTVYTIQQILANPAKAAEYSRQAGQGSMNFDLSQLPPGTDIFTFLAQSPRQRIDEMMAMFDQRFSSLGETATRQTALAAVKAEYVSLGMDTGRLEQNYILQTGVLMLGVSLLSVACTIIVGMLSARSGAGLARDLRKDVFKKVTNFSNTEFDKFSTASLITRSTNDINQVQMLVIMSMRMVLYAPIVGIGGIIRAIGKSPSMWWIIALALALLILMVVVTFVVSTPRFKIIQSLIDRLNLVMRENLSGMMVIRAFNQQGYEEQRFDRANRELTDVNLFVNRVMVVIMPFMMLIMNGLSLTILWVGAHQVADSTIQIGDMMAFIQYAIQIVFSFLMMSFMFIFLPRAAVSAGRIADVLATEPVVVDPPQPRQFTEDFSGTVEFRDVCFRYPDAEEDVLHNISFTAQPGQTTAFIGSTGSGKSTVVNLIPRFYDVTSGGIYINGIDIRQVEQKNLRDKIGYIPQKGILFSGTIDSNLRYADEAASQPDIDMAADIAQASEFIQASPAGYQTEISQGGTNVSGGQKQRLSIARALVKQPPIYIFDDSFSALDFRTDAALRRALREKATRNSTVLIVTQRVSTIMNAEQIIVLEEGRVVGIGTHPELMHTCETYREIATSQLKLEVGS